MISAIMLPLGLTLSQDMLKLSVGTKFEIFPDRLIRTVCKYSIFSLLSQISYLSSSGFVRDCCSSTSRKLCVRMETRLRFLNQID